METPRRGSIPAPVGHRRRRSASFSRFMKNPFGYLNSIFTAVDFSDRESIEKMVTSHKDSINMIQEMLLWRKPLPFALSVFIINLILVIYRQIRLPFYCYIMLFIIFMLLYRVYSPKIIPILCETLFPQEAAEGSTNTVVKEEEEQGEKEPESNRIRDVGEVVDAIMLISHPFIVIRDAFRHLNQDKSVTGQWIVVGVYLFGFWSTYALDLFWPFVFVINAALLFPGVYFHPTLWKRIKQISEDRRKEAERRARENM